MATAAGAVVAAAAGAVVAATAGAVGLAEALAVGVGVGVVVVVLVLVEVVVFAELFRAATVWPRAITLIAPVPTAATVAKPAVTPTI